MTLPLRPPRYINFFEPFHFTAGDQLVVPLGVSHISLPLQEVQLREWEKKKERTNNMLGLTQGQKESYVTLCMCRLTLAWISSENSTTLLECWLILTRLPSLLWTSSHLIGLSALRCRLVTRVTLWQLPTSQSLCLTPRSQVQNPLSGFAPKQTKESFAWRTTYIVLQESIKEHCL